tara:strand:- start:1613 stop:1978 length:366 start_codon:yes stop_codon:yes gene_type:complete
MIQSSLFELFSKVIVQEETVEEAIERVYDAAAEEWKAEATSIIHHLCQNQSEFDLDTVAEKLKPIDYIKHKPRAVGNLMRKAKDFGWCRQVGITTSKRLSRHGGYIAQYESLVYSSNEIHG